NIQVYQNSQLPIRWGMPKYAIKGQVVGGCYSGCEVSCQGSCETSCQGTCEVACKTGCETSCQATCETFTQGGGGCIREGTPVTVWDGEAQEYIEVPVEQLQPGMILPFYDPDLDTIVHGTMTQLQDAGYSSNFLRIETDNGPAIECTFSQPFDVMVPFN